MVSFRHFASYVTCALFVLCAIGCHSKQTPINKLENFTEEIQNKAQDYTEEDWKASAEELEQIEKEIEQYKSEYTDEELKEIGRLKGICLAQFTNHSFKTFKNGLEDAMKEAEGLIEGFSQGFGDKEE